MPSTKDTPGEVEFFPLTNKEMSGIQQGGFKPTHATFECGACGKATQGRVVGAMIRKSDGKELLWCMCSCDRQEPTVLVKQGETLISQSPISKEFHPNDRWPKDLAALYDEAAKSYSASAFTACAMVCRKVLMATACAEGDEDGKGFVDYVNYITESVLTFPRAKTAIDSIRSIGNEANHKVTIITRDDAKRAMQIVTYMLDTIYALPTA
ncbi:MAG TPA: DUF4145 domain-containing protein [Planctomycetaceae bacterium]|jgi:hypothetical protein